MLLQKVQTISHLLYECMHAWVKLVFHMHLSWFDTQLMLCASHTNTEREERGSTGKAKDSTHIFHLGSRRCPRPQLLIVPVPWVSEVLDREKKLLRSIVQVVLIFSLSVHRALPLTSTPLPTPTIDTDTTAAPATIKETQPTVCGWRLPPHVAQFPDGTVPDMLLELGSRDVERHGAPESIGCCVVRGVGVDFVQLLFNGGEEGKRPVCSVGKGEGRREGELKKEGRERERGGKKERV